MLKWGLMTPIECALRRDYIVFAAAPYCGASEGTPMLRGAAKEDFMSKKQDAVMPRRLEQIVSTFLLLYFIRRKAWLEC